MSKTKPIMPRSPLIAKEGLPFLLVLGLLQGLFWELSSWYPAFRIVAAIFTFFFLFTLNFFRNPDRTTPEGEGNVVSPADGTVISVVEVDENRFLNKKLRRISIFMSVFNVHVNRMAFTGKVTQVSYNPGKFLIGYAEKASLDNEQNALVVQDAKGREVLFVQIAGYVARRIVCYAKVGDEAECGERFGLIRFGSRVDVYLPLDMPVNVKVGDKTKAGETLLGKFV